MTSINFWAVLVASVVTFAIGALWYSPVLFGKEWMRLKHISEEDVTEESKRGMWKRYLAQFVSTLVFFCILGFFISATGSTSASDAVFLAFLAWIGFSVTTAVGDLLWNKTPFKLALINEVCALVSWLAGAAIIGAWR